MKRLFTAIAVTSAFVAMFAMNLPAQMISPGGRLTLSANTPVMASDVVNASTIYYVPYVNNYMPFTSDGVHYGDTTFSPMSLSLYTGLPTGNLYDVFAFYTTSSPTSLILCSGPAWSSSTMRSVQLSYLSNGIWVNATALSVCYINSGGSYYSPQAATAFYLGTFYTTSSGETSMQFKPAAASGGTGNILGVYNAYNRVRTISRCTDSNSSWTYTSSMWAMLDAGAASPANSISFVAGLQQSFVEADLQVQAETSSTSVVGAIGVSLDSASPEGTLALTSNATFLGPIHAFDHYTPQLGFHTISGQQWASGSTASFSTNSGTAEELKVALEM